jgi:oligopeptidase A
MWFEKWIYHPQFAASLSLTPEEREGLILCQRIKALEYKRTHVERAITAALDFEVHRRTNSGLKDSFRRMDERFAISRYCSLGDFPVYFTWPMFQANPGANFAYLWGAADSAEKFMPFMQQRIEEISSPAEVRASFSSCFDFDEPSTEPDSQAVFEFYDSLLGLDSGLQEL